MQQWTRMEAVVICHWWQSRKSPKSGVFKFQTVWTPTAYWYVSCLRDRSRTPSTMKVDGCHHITIRRRSLRRPLLFTILYNLHETTHSACFLVSGCGLDSNSSHSILLDRSVGGTHHPRRQRNPGPHHSPRKPGPRQGQRHTDSHHGWHSTPRSVQRTPDRGSRRRGGAWQVAPLHWSPHHQSDRGRRQCAVWKVRWSTSGVQCEFWHAQ